MQQITDYDLEKITGGTTISGTVINALKNIIELLQDAGYALGSGIRRISENNLCPLE